MSSKFQAALCAAVLLAIVPMPMAHAADGAASNLSGTDGGDMRVLIRKIDDGDILWVGGYNLGTKAKITPGQHVVSVMCEFHFSGGSELKPGTLSLTVEPGKDYALAGAQSADGNSCTVTAAPK